MAQPEAQQEPMPLPFQPNIEDEVGGYEEEFPQLYKFLAPTCFLVGIMVQTYRPLFNWFSLTVYLAEIIVGVTLGVGFMVMGMWMVTQIPMLGWIINIVNFHLRMPYMINYQLFPQQT